MTAFHFVSFVVLINIPFLYWYGWAENVCWLAWRNVQPSISGCNINKGIIEAATYTTKNAKYTCYSLLFTTTTMNDERCCCNLGQPMNLYVYTRCHTCIPKYTSTHTHTYTNIKIWKYLQRWQQTQQQYQTYLTANECVCVCVNERVSIRWYVKYDYDIIILVAVVVHAQVVAEPFFVYFLMLPLCWNLFFFSLFDEGTTTATIQ